MVLLNNTLELLRPLVETKAWNYCIVWKFTDNPSRYIEMVGCCCIGSVCENVKVEMELYNTFICKDTYIQHSIRTTACEKLALMPFSLPFYDGIHGEVAMSKQPFWLSNDISGTQLIMPVDGGLIELFRSKHVPADQRMIETFIGCLGDIVDHGFYKEDLKTNLNSHPYHDSATTQEPVNPVPLSVIYPEIQGSPSGDGTEVMMVKRKKVKEKPRSNNLIAERKRRKRINDALYALRALVPKISKMDKASILVDAFEYIRDLQKNVEELQDELKELEEQADKVNDDEMEVEVEVHKIGAQELLLKLICSHRPSRFLKIMETLDSLGLQVIDANITTCNDRMLNILNVEVKGKGVVANSLKDSLLTCWRL
uniref:transcription factor ABORTED MICROSPORES-like isoform X2 n=1 Tax=Erigeron canadensis TaxID=72917 RepID=UPI001CB92950|nr:transcription factor ABORTED MICROSPORES-like isoform X2 [Erigeron canadensis]